MRKPRPASKAFLKEIAKDREKKPAKPLPINKRFPGEHVIRAKIWTPDGTVEIEGPLPRWVASMVTALLISHPKATVAQQEMLAVIKAEILKKGVDL